MTRKSNNCTEKLFSWLYRPDMFERKSTEKESTAFQLADLSDEFSLALPPLLAVHNLLTSIQQEDRPSCAYFFRPKIEDHALVSSFAHDQILPRTYVFQDSRFTEQSPSSWRAFQEAENFSNDDLLEFIDKNGTSISPLLSGSLPVPHRREQEGSSVLISAPGEFDLQLEFEQRRLAGITSLFTCSAEVIHAFVALPIFQNQFHSLHPLLDMDIFKRRLLLEGGFTLHSLEK